MTAATQDLPGLALRAFVLEIEQKDVPLPPPPAFPLPRRGVRNKNSFMQSAGLVCCSGTVCLSPESGVTAC